MSLRPVIPNANLLAIRRPPEELSSYYFPFIAHTGYWAQEAHRLEQEGKPDDDRHRLATFLRLSMSVPFDSVMANDETSEEAKTKRANDAGLALGALGVSMFVKAWETNHDQLSRQLGVVGEGLVDFVLTEVDRRPDFLAEQEAGDDETLVKSTDPEVYITPDTLRRTPFPDPTWFNYSNELGHTTGLILQRTVRKTTDGAPVLLIRPYVRTLVDLTPGLPSGGSTGQPSPIA